MYCNRMVPNRSSFWNWFGTDLALYSCHLGFFNEMRIDASCFIQITIQTNRNSVCFVSYTPSLLRSWCSPPRPHSQATPRQWTLTWPARAGAYRSYSSWANAEPVNTAVTGPLTSFSKGCCCWRINTFQKFEEASDLKSSKWPKTWSKNSSKSLWKKKPKIFS